MKKMLFVAVALVLALFAATQVFATTSRTIVIEDISGTVNMTRGTARSFNARVGTRLAAGNTLSTGAASNADLLLDDGSLLRLNASTTVDVTSTGNQLRINVITGSVSVNAQPQTQNNQIQVTAGNATMGIRGTLFTVVLAEGTVYVNLLEGELEGTTPAGPYILLAGQTLVVCDTEETEMRPLQLDLLDQFTLETIYEHVEMLLAVGTISQRDIATVSRLIETRQAEAEAREEARLLPIEELFYVPEYDEYELYEEVEYTPTHDESDSDAWDDPVYTPVQGAPVDTSAPAPVVVETPADDGGYEYEYYEDGGGQRRRRRWRWRSSGR